MGTTLSSRIEGRSGDLHNPVAAVFRARDDRLDADVAIKVLAENYSFNPDVRERSISEGHLLRRVDSPHVVKVFDLGETDAGQRSSCSTSPPAATS